MCTQSIQEMSKQKRKKQSDNNKILSYKVLSTHSFHNVNGPYYLLWERIRTRNEIYNKENFNKGNHSWFFLSSLSFLQRSKRSLVHQVHLKILSNMLLSSGHLSNMFPFVRTEQHIQRSQLVTFKWQYLTSAFFLPISHFYNVKFKLYQLTIHSCTSS